MLAQVAEAGSKLGFLLCTVDANRRIGLGISTYLPTNLPKVGTEVDDEALYVRCITRSSHQDDLQPYMVARVWLSWLKRQVQDRHGKGPWDLFAVRKQRFEP